MDSGEDGIIDLLFFRKVLRKILRIRSDCL